MGKPNAMTNENDGFEEFVNEVANTIIDCDMDLKSENAYIEKAYMNQDFIFFDWDDIISYRDFVVQVKMTVYRLLNAC